MTFEDTFRVADLKTRSARFARVREEVRAEPGQLVGITEFMKPRIEEIAGTLPARTGAMDAGLASRCAVGWRVGPAESRCAPARSAGFFCCTARRHEALAARDLRYEQENARIEAWLARIDELAAGNYALAVELARAQRLVKGYGETHERGWRISARSSGSSMRWHAHRRRGGVRAIAGGRLADEEGTALAKELAALGAPSVTQ